MQRNTLLAGSVVCALTIVGCSQAPQTMLSPSAGTEASTAANADGSTLKVTAPKDLSPNGGVVDTRRPTLSFTNASGRFQQSGFTHDLDVQDANGAPVYQRVLEESPNSSSHTLDSDLSLDTTFRWRTRGRLGTQVGPWSDFAQFRTPAPSGPTSPGVPPGIPFGDPVATSVAAANEINRRFPNLRVQNNFEWIAKVVYLASLVDPRIGHSSSHSDTAVTRRNELGIRDGADVVGGRQSYRSVSLFQINPPAGDPMRPAPLLENRFDFWFPQVPVPF